MFDMMDQIDGRAGCERLADVTTGLVAGTKVATPIGWRVIEGIVTGDRVLTFDGGMQRVVAVRRQVIYSDHSDRDPETWPLHVPAGMLGNRADMTLMCEQAVLVESDAAEEIFGDPFAMIPALALEGYRGITRVAPPARLEVITLVFEQDEVVFANIGALFFCPAQMDLLDDSGGTYRTLPLDQADMLVDLLDLEDCARNARVPKTPTPSQTHPSTPELHAVA